MAIIMGKGCLEAIYGLMGWKGLTFLNLHISVNIVYKPFKFGLVILDILSEGTVSQIFNLGPSSIFM